MPNIIKADLNNIQHANALKVLQGNGVAKSAYQGFGFNAYELDPENGTAELWQKKLIDNE